MKKSILLPLLLLASGIFAQNKFPGASHTTLQSVDPTKMVEKAPSDTEAPVVTCLNGVEANLSQTGQVSIEASDILQFVQDNETPTAEIKIGIRKAGTGTGFPVDQNGSPITKVTFFCPELGAQPLELWAIDEAGNADYCEMTANIKDDFGYCNNIEDTLNICIHYGCNGEPMEGVSFNITGGSVFQPPFVFQIDSVTGPDGCATAIIPALNGTSYTIAAQKDGDPLNGLSTNDLLLIGKHILGLEPLDNPYKLIAADANKSGSVTTFDLVELRKLILGIYPELPNNTSWRFVNADFEFPNPLNPFSTAFPEFIMVGDSQSLDATLIGIKIGDVDCTAMFNNVPPPDFPDANLAMPDTVLQAGQVYDIPIYMAENGLWQGYQFSLDFDPQKLAFQGISYHNLTSAANWNLLQASNGTLTTSWFQSDLPGAFGPNYPIAVFHFQSLGNVSLKDVVSLNNQRLHPEGYADWNAEKRDLLLSFIPQLKSPSVISTAEHNIPIVEADPSADLVPPVVNCLNGLSVNIMPTGMIQLWATDYLLSVSDNETPTDQIKIAVRKAGTGFGFPVDKMGNPSLSVVFDCNQLGTQGVELWAKDLKGNTAHCLTYTIVQDNLGSCLGNPSGDWLIEICAKTEASDGVEEAQFMVTGTNPNGPFYANEVTGPNISCGYFDVPLGSNVTAMPVKDDNPLNGVTTYDLVLISRHFRGIEPLNSPYKIIAADANHDGLVTMEDSIELTKLILGIYTELPNNTSWRFVDKSYTFPDPSNPFAEVFPESLTVQNIQSPASADFIAIKVGDVNNTAIQNLVNPAPEDRAAVSESLSIGLPNPNPTEGGATLPIYLPSAENLRLEISDMAGKLLWVNDLQLEKGSHNLEIPTSSMSGKSVYVWRVSAGGVVKAGKLVRI